MAAQSTAVGTQFAEERRFALSAFGHSRRESGREERTHLRGNTAKCSLRVARHLHAHIGW